MSKQSQWIKQIKAGESLHVEFKRQAPKLERLARSFSAFSNSAGGSIFFGVEDDGSITGLEHLDGTRDIVIQVAEFHCRPAIQPEIIEWEHMPGTRVLVVHIPEAENKPVYAVNPNNPKDSWPFFRSDKENLALDRQSIKTMRRGPSIDIEEDVSNLDRHAIKILNTLADHPRQTLNKLAKSTNIGANRAKKILVHLEKNGWIHSYFNEKRREFSLTIDWKKR